MSLSVSDQVITPILIGAGTTAIITRVRAITSGTVAGIDIAGTTITRITGMHGEAIGPFAITGAATSIAGSVTTGRTARAAAQPSAIAINAPNAATIAAPRLRDATTVDPRWIGLIAANRASSGAIIVLQRSNDVNIALRRWNDVNAAHQRSNDVIIADRKSSRATAVAATGRGAESAGHAKAMGAAIVRATTRV